MKQEKGSHSNGNYFPTSIAIIGMSCVFPKAANLLEYWTNIKNGVDAISEVPSTHWQKEDYLDKDVNKPDCTYTTRGGFIDAVDFDPLEFGITPNAIEATDTSQLLGLVAAKRALLDAGYGENREFNRERVSVILGVTGTLELVIPLGARLSHPVWRNALRDAGVEETVANDVIERISDSFVEWQENSFPGLLGNVTAGRIANRLDLRGTNCVVDAACASSLGAMYMALLELNSGRCDMVITGGLDTFNDIFMYMCFSKSKVLSASGDAKPFDRNGDGTILGEGMGMMVLKRLEDAERDNDNIYAVIRGVGSSSDGKGNAVYVPSSTGQSRALKAAYDQAGISPDTVELVEAHGTGTKVGDTAEVNALTDVFRSFSSNGAWCALGSVKSQIGHTKAAAGIAGLIKVVMALRHKVLPPTIKVEAPIEILEDKETPFYLNIESRPWLSKAEHPRRAAVSAFGFGGSNFHCVVEEYDKEKNSIDWDPNIEIICFSGNSIQKLIHDLEGFLRDFSLEKLAQQAVSSRASFFKEHSCRLTMVFERGKSDVKHLISNSLEMFRKYPGKDCWSIPAGVYFASKHSKGKLAIIFSGQGSQYIEMQSSLACQFPQMQKALTDANDMFSRNRGDDLSGNLTDYIYPLHSFDPSIQKRQEESLRDTRIAQPAIGAVSLGMYNILTHFGIKPDVVAGHSYGELTALCAASCFSPHSFYRLSCVRGNLMATRNDTPGGMVAVLDDSNKLVDLLKRENLNLVIANKNAPDQTVLSGHSEEIVKVCDILSRLEIKYKLLPVSSAFHSLFMSTVLDHFSKALKSEKLVASNVAVFANKTALQYPDDPELMCEILTEQISNPVEFVREIENIYKSGVETFLEVGPGNKLAGMVKSILAEKEHKAYSMDASSGKRSGIFDLAITLARIAVSGFAIDLTKWNKGLADGSFAENSNKKSSVVLPICGSNYVKPKPKKSPNPIKSNVSSSSKDSFGKKVKPEFEKKEKTSVDVKHIDTKKDIQVSGTDKQSINEMLRVSNENMIVMQKMQEQTAKLHKQFLDNQEKSLKSLLSLMDQQRHLRSLSGGGIKNSLAPETTATRVVVEEKLESSSESGKIEIPKHTYVQDEKIEKPVDIEKEDEPVTSAAAYVSNVLLNIVSEKTGYPVEMLELDMSLDADLGIDSIKRVEILSALQETIPDAPEIKPEHMGVLGTLRQIILFLSETGEISDDSGTNKGKRDNQESGDIVRNDTGRIEEVLLHIVSEKTGYPVEMLELDMSLDADLGIDSIKRVEILSALQEQFPALPEIKPEHMGILSTLDQIIKFLTGPPDAILVEQEFDAKKYKDQLDMINFPDKVNDNTITRSILCPVDANQDKKDNEFSIRKGSEIWILRDGTNLSTEIKKSLEGQGYSPRLISVNDVETLERPGLLGGLILVAPPDPVRDLFFKSSFAILQKAASGLRNAGNNGGALFVTVTRLDGEFGLNGLIPKSYPISGGLAGLTKTAKREWPEVHCKALDVSSNLDDNGETAAMVVAEMFNDSQIEIGISKNGRTSLALRQQPLADNDIVTKISNNDVIVITGGAKGVTAKVSLALAKTFKPVLVILGRSNFLGDEPDWSAELSNESELKRAILNNADSKLAPKQVEEQYRSLMANREILENINRMQKSGAQVYYYSVDVRDTDAVNKIILDVCKKYGPIKGLIYGAGVLADRLIEDKTWEQFNTVYTTKVSGLLNLLDMLKHDELKFIALFSSYTGRYGRVGQIDYAVANEVLNKIAQQQSRLRPSCRVVSVNWGPWNGGMVTSSLKIVFKSENVELIDPEVGANYLIQEICVKADAPVEVVVMGCNGNQNEMKGCLTENNKDDLALAFDLKMDTEQYPFLLSHVIDNRAVLPMSLIMEWSAQAALHLNPGLVFFGINDLRILKGVTFGQFENCSVRFFAEKASKENGVYVVPVDLKGMGAKGVPAVHARCRVILGEKKLPQTFPPLISVQGTYDRGVDEIYNDILFHGKEFQGIEEIENYGEKGISAFVRCAPSVDKWIKSPFRKRWLTDPLAIDCSFQMMSLWCFEMYQACSLPCFAGQYRQYKRVLPSNGMHVVINVKETNNKSTIADIDFLDDNSECLAQIKDYECVISPSLINSFRKNRFCQKTEFNSVL